MLMINNSYHKQYQNELSKNNPTPNLRLVKTSAGKKKMCSLNLWH